MTHVVEFATIKLELNHCEADSSTVYGGDTDLWDVALGMLPAIKHLPRKGMLVCAGVTMRWDRGGLEEAPELGGGDN